MKNIFIRNNNYQFRVNINSELEKYFKCKLYIKSLGTKNKVNAIKLRNILYNKFKILQDSIKMKLTDKQIQNLVNDFKNTKLDLILDDFDYMSATKLNHTIEVYKFQFENNDYSLVTDISETLITEINENSEENFINIENISKLLMKNIIDKLEDIKSGVNREIKHKPTVSSIANPNINSIADIKIENSFITIKDLIVKYLKEYSISKNWTETYIKTQSSYLFSFERYFYNKNIREMKRESLIEYKDNYLGKLKKDKSKDLISKKTINQHLTTLTSFFTFLLENDYIDKNICSNMKLKIKENDEIQRLPYIDDDISVLFNYFSKISSKYKNEFLDIIKIGMYSGLRQNEILQLKSSDIIIENDILCFSINSDDNKRVKNIHSKRLVPVHSQIQNLVNELKNKNKNALFSMSRSYFSKKYSDYNQKCGFGETKVFHSLRHTFSNKLKQARVENTILDEITGHAHSQSSMSLGRYSNKYNVNILKEAIEKVEYNI